MNLRTVLLIDDDPVIREALSQTMELKDITPITAGSYIEAKEHITRNFPGVILSDIKMPGKDGFFLMDYVNTIDPELPVILLTGHGDIPMAVRGMDSGAFSFLEKPCSSEQLLGIIEKALQKRKLIIEHRQIIEEAQKGDLVEKNFPGTSRLAQTLREHIRQAAQSSADILISGCPGSGADLIVEIIHNMSQRAHTPLIKLSSIALTPETFKTHCQPDKDVTLYFDEISQLSPALQFELFTLLENSPHFWFIASTYQDLKKKIHKGQFHPNLYYRLELMQIRLPPLDQRKEDIPIIFQHFLNQFHEDQNSNIPDVTPEILAALTSKTWPGDMQALKNTATRFAMDISDFAQEPPAGLSEHIAGIERSFLISALERHAGRITLVAQELRIPRKTLYDKLARYGIKPECYRP